MRATTDRVPPAACLGHRRKRLKARVFVQLVFLTGATFATLAVFL